MKSILFGIVLLAVGCTDAEWDSNVGQLGEEHIIRLYSGGTLVSEWISTGAVQDDPSGAGFAFREKGSNKFIRIQGSITVETRK